jgi:long-subunit fatty acid transport protein
MNLLLVVVAGVLAGAGGLAAQEERAVDHFAGVGVRAMGMGGAYVGVADDFTAIHWNPAGLAQLRRREGYVAFLRSRFASESRMGPLAPAASAELTNTRFGSMGLVYPYPVYRGSLVFAAGFNRVADFDWALRLRGFDQQDSLQHDGTFRHEGGISTTSLAAAVDVSPSVSLGATLSISGGEDDWANDFTWADSADYFVQKRFVAHERFADDYRRRYGATLGAMVRSSRDDPKVRLGATVTAATRQEIRYTFRGVLADPGYTEVVYDDGRTERIGTEEVKGGYELALPLEFGAGLSYRPVKGLLLAGSAHVAEWSQTEYRGVDVHGLRGTGVLEIQYRNVLRYHLGLEYQVPTIALDLRTGFYTDPLPFVGPRHPEDPVDAVRNPLIVAEQERRFFSMGAGLLFEETVKADLAWVRGSYEQVEGTQVEEGTVDRVFLGVTYLF